MGCRVAATHGVAVWPRCTGWPQHLPWGGRNPHGGLDPFVDAAAQRVATTRQVAATRGAAATDGVFATHATRPQSTKCLQHMRWAPMLVHGTVAIHKWLPQPAVSPKRSGRNARGGNNRRGWPRASAHAAAAIFGWPQPPQPMGCLLRMRWPQPMRSPQSMAGARTLGWPRRMGRLQHMGTCRPLVRFGRSTTRDLLVASFCSHPPPGHRT